MHPTIPRHTDGADHQKSTRTHTTDSPARSTTNNNPAVVIASDGQHADIIPDPATNTLHVRLDPLPTPRHTAAIAELCEVLNDTNTVYPGTELTLRYSTKSHRRPPTN